MRLATQQFLSSTTSYLRAYKIPPPARKQAVLFQSRNMSTSIPSETAQEQSRNQQTQGTTGSLPTSAELGIENTDIKCAPGVTLNDQDKVVVGSILDLFAGLPSLKKLQLWADDATFTDPLTQAHGRKQYEAQWYGLQKTFSSITRLHQSVTSLGPPLTMDLSTKYTLKIPGLGTKDTVVDSVVRIFTDADSGRIIRVEDRWKNELPEGVFAKAFQKLNAVTVPLLVSVPKNGEEDQKKGN